MVESESGSHKTLSCPPHIVEHLCQLAVSDRAIRGKGASAVDATDEAEVVSPAGALTDRGNLFLGVGAGQKQDGLHFLPILIDPTTDVRGVRQFIDGVKRVDFLACGEKS